MNLIKMAFHHLKNLHIRNGDISAINLPDVSMNRMEFEQFQLIENGSNKGKAVLLSNIGFKYTLSRKTNHLILEML